MKQSFAQDTLAYQLGIRPALQFRDMRAIPLKATVKAMNAFFVLPSLYDWIPTSSGLKEPVCGKPELDALVFYMLNHAVSLVRQERHPLEPLGTLRQVLELYHRELSLRTARMFYYLLLICTREARHEHKSTACKKLQTKYGVPFSFQTGFPDSNTSALTYMTEHCPEVDLGNFTQFLAEQFYEGSYSSSFGGPAWGKVADTLRDFVHGKTTAEMMLDTAFTLCHNGGPIFNKGMLFDHYNTSALQKILDVQRSGQIPQLVAAKGLAPYTENSKLQSMHAICAKVLGPQFAGSVDWYKVEALGSIGKYASEKAAQAAKGAVPINPFQTSWPKNKAVEETAGDMGGIAPVTPTVSGPKVYVYPGQFVVKVKSPRHPSPIQS